MHISDRSIVNGRVWVIAILLSLISVSCGGPETAGNGEKTPIPTGGPCSYSTVAGKAVFSSLLPTPNGFDATFNFIPLDPSARRSPNDMGIHQFVSKEWVDAHKAKVGTSIAANRREITEGSCSPVIYEIPSLSEIPIGR